MHRIDGTAGSNVAVAKPSAGAVQAVVGYFAAATQESEATILTFAWANSVQEEIAGVVIGAGASLDKADDGQLLAAINTLIGGTQSVAFAESSTVPTTVSGTTADGSAIICSWNAGAGGPVAGGTGADGSVALACGGGTVSGQSAVMIACNAGTVAGDLAVMMASATGSDIAAGSLRCTLISADGVDVLTGTVASAVIATIHAEIGASRSAIIACSGSTTDGDDIDIISGSSNAIIACDGAATRRTIMSVASKSAIIASANADISAGEYNFVAASGRADAASQADISAGQNNAILASLYGVISGTATTSAIIASGASVGGEVPEIDGGAVATIIASTGRMRIPGAGSLAAIIASTNNSATNPTQITGDGAAVVAVSGACVVSGNRSALVCSSTTGAGPTLSANDTLAGAAGTALTWQIDSASGLATFTDLALSGAFDATTGGSAASAIPNLPTGATGTNFRWIKINDGTNDYWVPAWSAA